MQQENKKKKIMIVGGAGKNAKIQTDIAQKIAEKKGLNTVSMPHKDLKKEFNGVVSKENIMPLTAPNSMVEDIIYTTDIDKQGIRGVTNNRKLKKKRKKKGKKTHRNKKRKRK